MKNYLVQKTLANTIIGPQERKYTDKFMSPLRVEITDLIHREKKSRRKCGNISGTNTL